MEKLLLTTKEAREVLSLNRTRMYEMLAAGEIPSIRIGRAIRIPVKALEQWIEQQQ